MKKNIFFVSVFMVFLSCSTKKDAFLNRTYQNFTSYYNTLFHGKEALKSELKNKKKEHKDNFYEGYIEVFTQNALATTSEDENIQAMASQFFGVGGNNTSESNYNAFQKAEEKALKIIESKSMVFQGVEKNKEVFNAYILLAEARIYQGKLLEALDALNQIYFTMAKDKRYPLAKIYEGLVYSKMKNYIRAEDIFSRLDRDNELKKEYRKLLSVYYAENMLYTNRKEDALKQLDIAMKLNKFREIKSRISFLKGQVLAELGKKEDARGSFVQAYKYANNFEFEVKSQIEIAKTFDEGDDYEAARKYLEKISEKGIYASRKNEFYYALGLMANKAGRKKEAQEFFQKSIKEKATDNNIRGLAYFEIGKSYFEKDNYVRSGAYYDSALVVIEHQPAKLKIQELSENIKNISRNYYLVKKNDSILALAKMSQSEREAYFQRYIDDLKEKEEKQQREEAEKARKNRRNEAIDFYNPNTDFASFVTDLDDKKSNKFYFSNQNAVAKGSLEFKKVWGNRVLGDNWRFSRTEKTTLVDLENKTLGRGNTGDSRRFEIAYYTEKIPNSPQVLLNLKKDRDTASLGLGRMYEAYFQNTNLATKTLFELVEQKPEDEVKLQALYLIFSMNFEKNPSLAEKAKILILKDFPYTPHAEFVKNPRRANFNQTEEEVKNTYQKAYGLYAEEKFEDAKKVIAEVLEKYSKDALIPKFELLNAFITGKTHGKEIMLLQLQQIVFNYENTLEGIRAKEILTRLKSELSKPIQEKNNNIEQNPTNNNSPSLDNSMIINISQEVKKDDKLKSKIEESDWESEYIEP